MSWAGRILLAVIAIGVLYSLRAMDGAEDLSARLAPDNHVVMYSLTTCPYCVKTRAFLTASGIPFTEHYLDTDPQSEREFMKLLSNSGAPPGGVGTPSLIVNDKLLLNNPPFELIKRHLRLVGT